MKGIKLIEETLSTKKKYYVEFEERKTNFLAKEIFNNGTKKYYPFKEKDGLIEQKYNGIAKITIEPAVVVNSGISFTENRGFGFTSPKGVQNLFYFFQNKFPKIQEVTISINKETKLTRTKLTLNINDFEKLEESTGTFVENKKNEGNTLYQLILNKLLPAHIDEPEKPEYVSGSLNLYLDKHSKVSFSDDETERLMEILINSGLPQEILISTKANVDIVYIEDILTEYKKILEQVTDTSTLEEKWHQFFKKHAWIFSQIFSFPAIFLDDKVNVGGHNIGGSKDKIVDFLYRNKINSNIAFIEIKTHLTQLVLNSEYRNDLYPISNQLTGAIVQVLDQKNNLLKNYHSIVGKTAESLNSVCVVIAGNTEKFSKKGQDVSFELFRWSNKDVVIIPYNELLDKIENILELFKKKSIE